MTKRDMLSVKILRTESQKPLLKLQWWRKYGSCFWCPISDT